MYFKAEMRNARLQAQDLSRTNQFVTTLLSKDDLKDLEKQEAPEPPKLSQQMVNGNGVARVEHKARFSDPPAPPPQQPLPEKPDVPAMKRGGERPKSGPPNASPIRQDNLSQIIQLTEALNNAKRDIDLQTARMRELESMLQKEREAREVAEDLARRLEESATTQVNGFIKTDGPETEQHPSDTAKSIDTVEAAESNPSLPSATETADQAASELQSRIDGMECQVVELKEQLLQWQQRCEIAESERDADRKSLEVMVIQLREEEARRVEAQEVAQAKTRPPLQERSSDELTDDDSPLGLSAKSVKKLDAELSSSSDGLEGSPTLSRANTIKPLNPQRGASSQDQRLQASLPYASMLGVVLIGMGMMAYINGWQAPPPRVER